MRARCNEQQLLKQVEIDTKEVLNRLGREAPSVDLEGNMGTFTLLLRRAYKSMPEERLPTMGEVKEAMVLATTREDYIFVCSYWIKRLLANYRALGSHLYNTEQGVYRLCFCLSNGVMSLSLMRGCKNLLVLNGKPTRVFAALLGEKLLTKAASLGSFKAKQMKLHFLTHYIPEMYRKLEEDECLTSCMSKPSDEYRLPDEYHPVMAYEESPNAVLCLLYDDSKGRHVARAVGMVGEGELSFNSAYGSSGCKDYFQDLGCEATGSLGGLVLKRVDTGDGILAPFIDGDAQSFKDTGEHLLVSSCGDDSSYETGRLVTGTRCEYCGERVEETTYIEYDGEVCQDCLDEKFVYLEGYEWVRREDTRYVESRDETHHEDDVVYSDYLCEYIHTDDAIDVVYTHSRWGKQDDYIDSDRLEDLIDSCHVLEIDGEPYEYPTDEEDAA